MQQIRQIYYSELYCLIYSFLSTGFLFMFLRTQICNYFEEVARNKSLQVEDEKENERTATQLLFKPSMVKIFCNNNLWNKSCIELRNKWAKNIVPK